MHACERIWRDVAHTRRKSRRGRRGGCAAWPSRDQLQSNFRFTPFFGIRLCIGARILASFLTHGEWLRNLSSDEPDANRSSLSCL